MKKQVLATILGIVIVLLLGTGFAFENEPEGFRGLKWGDPLTPEMELFLEMDIWVSIYQNPSDELKLGDACLDGILYQFCVSSPSAESRFLGVILRFKGKKNFDILETICRVKFSEPTEEGYNQLSWYSLAANVYLCYDSIDEDGYLSLGSAPIFSQYMEKKKKKQAEEAEEDW